MSKKGKLNVDYTKFLQKVLSEQEFELLSLPKTITDIELEDFLIKENFAFFLDWSGEDNDFDFQKFINARLTHLSDGVAYIDIVDVYENYSENTEGSSVSYLLSTYNKVLKEIGYQLIQRYTQSDYHMFLLVSIKDSKLLRNIKNDFWTFYVEIPNYKWMMIDITCGTCQEWENYGIPFNQYQKNKDLSLLFCKKCGAQLTNEVGETIGGKSKVCEVSI